MHGWLNRLRADTTGVAALELALLLPFIMLLLGGVVDVGRALYQAQMLDKALRAGAAYAAQTAEPFSAATKAVVENLVRTGNAAGEGEYLVSGFANPAAKVEVASGVFDLDGMPIAVIRVTAEVPFDPLLPGVTAIFDPTLFTVRLSHEQAYIGS